jgi:N-glycosylase/DNA lyase
MLPGFHCLPLPVAQLSLAAVLKCGQSFRWKEMALTPDTDLSNKLYHQNLDREYRLALHDRIICLRQTPDTLLWRALYPTHSETRPSSDMEAESLAWLRDYFQLDVDLVHLYSEWSMKDSVFNRLRDRFEGIRILRQDPWENLIS